MKKCIEILKNNKKVVIIAATIIGIILVSVIIFLVTKNNISQEEKLTSSLKELGIDFYENFYYNQISSDEKARAEFLEKYKDIGIKINLDNLSRFKTEETEEIVKTFVNDETKKECDRINSMIIIYPKEPYEKKSYSIDAILKCGYEEKK